jgi:hypothetical protein
MGLSTHFPEPVVVRTALGDIPVRALTLKKIPAMAKAISPFWSLISGKNNGDFVGQILDVMGDHFDAVMHALHVATDRPIADLETLELDDAVELISAVVVVNMDFFSQRLLPKIAAVKAQKQATHGTASLSS